MLLMTQFHTRRPKHRVPYILPVSVQIRSWRKANRKMRWGILKEEFDEIHSPPQLSDLDQEGGFVGAILCYGFGDDGSGHSDAVISGKVAWDYARKSRRKKIWQCEYIDFENRPEDIRLRPEALKRPKGFYFVNFKPGGEYISKSATYVRKSRSCDTGCAAEGFQFLCPQC